MGDKIHRSDNRTIGGVCAGLGEYFNIDKNIVKVAFFLTIFTPFPIIITYLFMWMIIPKSEIS
jgi:phage shock protein PspC (stress-responsive transcriptional regulator)